MPDIFPPGDLQLVVGYPRSSDLITTSFYQPCLWLAARVANPWIQRATKHGEAALWRFSHQLSSGGNELWEKNREVVVKVQSCGSLVCSFMFWTMFCLNNLFTKRLIGGLGCFFFEFWRSYMMISFSDKRSTYLAGFRPHETNQRGELRWCRMSMMTWSMKGDWLRSLLPVMHIKMVPLIKRHPFGERVREMFKRGAGDCCVYMYVYIYI